jgi:hypothetical protein
MAVPVGALKRKQDVTAGKESTLAKMLSVGGGVVGGILGGMATGGAGAIGGAAGGSSLGGMIGGMLDPAKQATAAATKEADMLETSGDSAMARKLAAAREDRLAALRQAEASLPQLPPELREAYAPTIVQATMQEEKRRAMGLGG